MINISAAAEAAFIGYAFRRLFFLNNKTRSIVLNIICVFLISYNLYRYVWLSFETGRLHIPVEFSALSYFLVPSIVLLNIPFLRVWAAYSGLLAGGCYFLCMSVFGDMVYANYQLSSIVTALVNHGMLLLCGLLLISEKEFSFYSRWLLTAGLIFVGLHSLLMRGYFSGGRGIFIYELLFAFYPIEFFGGGIIPFYYILLFLLVILSFSIFYKLNNIMMKKQLLK